MLLKSVNPKCFFPSKLISFFYYLFYLFLIILIKINQCFVITDSDFIISYLFSSCIVFVATDRMMTI